jgi:hypothetical protein
MDDQLPIDMVSDILLPRDLRSELCIAGAFLENEPGLLTFRIDPGGAFQRRGYVRNIEGARFLVGLSERYLPDGPRVRVCGSDGIPAGDVPDQLRAASGWAYSWDAERDHWFDARPRLTPVWSGSRLDVMAATMAAAGRAKAEHLTHYLYAQRGKFVYANNPPREGAFFSVTLRGHWALHVGRATYPVESAPRCQRVREHACKAQPADASQARAGGPGRARCGDHPVPQARKRAARARPGAAKHAQVTLTG